MGKAEAHSLTPSFLPSLPSSGLRPSLLETTLLNTPGTQDLERIVPPVYVNDL